ncbi:Bcr/CflA family efflux MFS transporter [Actomonas aquatica]|uniref:Bcr/CflA family efflux MFS transporter n=1 Tax=Actomonas aquatica TaxID=2866162 RepID=A0ABZ1C4C6_9BACT|nr:Bcr/CflA family efflux MFS transporter [Opitutus sp. WL0086]WRQ86252.1 Bcr/CflA family efflux MFS transporter [Opitutus sp. WL0086]
MSKSHVPFSLTIALALTLMLGPFSVDTYLPAFPQMAGALEVSVADISLSISVYIFTLSFSQLIGGALSDHFGRRTVLLGGLALYLVAALVVGFAGNMALLLIGRAVQAFGAGWVLVSVPALVRDRVSGQDAAKLFSLIGLIMIVAPGIAPSVGSAILEVASWRWIFFFLAAYALFLIPVAKRVIFRQTPKRAVAPGTTGMLQRYLNVLREKRALPFVLWQAAGFSVLMLFITHASFIYQEHFGQSARHFSLLFAANIVAMLGFNLLNRLLLSRLPSLTVLRGATTVQALGMLLVVIATLGDWPVLGFMCAMMIAVGALGAVAPNLQANYLEFFPHSGASAAALLGATQFGVAGLASGLSTRLPHTLPAIVGAMGVAALVPVSTMLLTRRTLTAA